MLWKYRPARNDAVKRVGARQQIKVAGFVVLHFFLRFLFSPDNSSERLGQPVNPSTLSVSVYGDNQRGAFCAVLRM